MKITPVHTDEKSFYLDFYEQWTPLLDPASYGWVDFTFCHFEMEWAQYSGRIEVQAALLGFALTFTYIYDHSFSRELNERMKELDDLIARKSEKSNQ